MTNFRMGWLPDRPDFRDYCVEDVIKKYNPGNRKSGIKFIKGILGDDGKLTIENGQKSQERASVILPLASLNRSQKTVTLDDIIPSETEEQQPDDQKYPNTNPQKITPTKNGNKFPS